MRAIKVSILVFTANRFLEMLDGAIRSEAKKTVTPKSALLMYFWQNELSTFGILFPNRWTPNTISSVKLSSDREHLGIEQSLHFTHLALHSIIPTVDTLRRRERWQKASKWEHDSHAGTEAYMSDSFRHGASPLSFCTKAYMVCNSNNYILC